MKEKSEALTVAMSALLNKQPFFSSIIYGAPLTIIESTEHETAATDGKTMWVNPEFFAGMSVAERVFVLAHETLHCVLHHMGRGKQFSQSGVGPNMMPYNPKTYNKAADYVINDMLKVNGVGVMPEVGLWDKKYTHEMSVEQVYGDVYEEPDEDEDGGSGGDHGGFDEHMEPAEAPTNAEQTDMEATVKQAAASAKALGKLPASMTDLIESILNPSVPWNEVLMREMSASMNRDEKTWKRPNRRKLTAEIPMIMPSRTGSSCGDIFVVCDVSGSISTKEIAGFLGEVKGISDLACPERLILAYVDTEVKVIMDFDDMADLDDHIEDILANGHVRGGGTDMPAAFKYVSDYDMEPTTMVILTDMYTSFGKPQPYPVIWVSTTKNIVADHGVTIYADIT
jgi:predicted metal-dependent peptidase